jgi:DHA3 family macrolide efflux protein-like MFS transporter
MAIPMPQISNGSMRPFTILWLGQSISIIGSRMTTFALGVWLYKTYGSVTPLALVAFVSSIPSVVFSPIAGSIVDRWDRRKLLFLSDGMRALASFSIILLLYFQHLHIWHIYLAQLIDGIFIAMAGVAQTASTSLLVPKPMLGRANGMLQASEALSHVITPALAGALLVWVNLQGVMTVDFLTFFFSLAALAIVAIPNPTREDNIPERLLQRVITDTRTGWKYIRMHRGLWGLLLVASFINLFVTYVILLFQPMMLSFTSIKTMGMAMSISASAMVIGSVIMSLWRGPKRNGLSMLGTILVCGPCIVVAGLKPSVLLVTISAFIFFSCLPVINTSYEAIWQRKVPLEMQGRVFGLRPIAVGVMWLIAQLTVGPLADHVFTPWVATHSSIAGAIRSVIGATPGRSMGLFMSIVGLAWIAFALVALAYSPLRHIDSEIPDRIELGEGAEPEQPALAPHG